MSDCDAQRARSLLMEEYRKAPMGWGIRVPGDTKEFCLGAKNGLDCCLPIVPKRQYLGGLSAKSGKKNGSVLRASSVGC